jgi:ParB family chromosome partitioning protein
MEWALVENVQRADLNPLEEAAAYQALMSEFHLTQAEVAQRVGKSRSAIANTVRLQQLPAAAQDALLTNRITAGHARALLALPDTASMQRTLETILEQDLTVRQTEALIKEILQPETSSGRTPETAPDVAESTEHAQLRHLENRFRSALSTRVTLNRNDDGSGRLVVHFYNDEDLENLVRYITGEEPG